jgi:hypothetical protein
MSSSTFSLPQIMRWLAFDRKLADRFSRELIAPESRPPLRALKIRGEVYEWRVNPT